ncbi:MAG: ribonuclease D [Planctomycetota bacterium]|nr:MAG: ribonuclease D [Planctomycetota bacterium]
MSLPDLPPPTLVHDAAGLAALLEDLAGQREIAFDTEADSFFSYREKVCLVQVTVEERDYLVDPLSGLDIAPLGRVLADPTKVKIFHDGEYDVMIMKREYGFEFANLFDTRVAAAALGMEAPGLASVLKSRFGVELDKSMQRSDWAKRPLSEKQISYARLDTRFLLPLMHELAAELEERGRTMILDAECRRLEQLEPVDIGFQPDLFVRIKGVRDLDPIGRRILREVFIVREELAERRDVPPFRIMSNQVLFELARANPKDTRALARVHGFSSGMVRRLGDPVLAAIDRAHELGPLARLPVAPRRDGTDGQSEETLELYDRLRKWRKGVADAEGIESSYLLNRHVLLRIAEKRPSSTTELARIEGLAPWQIDMFADEMTEVVREFERALAKGELFKRRPRRGRR